MKSKSILLLLLLCSAVIANAQMRYFYANLQGSQEVPANSSTATGIVIITYNTATRLLQLNGDYQGLAAAATMAHIHGPAAPGTNAPVLFPLDQTGGQTGTLSGNATLTDAQELDLYGGNYYVNVHNSTYPGGEVRGRVMQTTVDQTDYYNGRLQGAQQVPPNGSGGSGSFVTLLDKATNTVYLTGSFTGLSNVATAGHIHSGDINSNGPVFLPLTVSAATSGTIHGMAMIELTDKNSMQSGSTYVNIHTATYPGGEIRGQVTMLSQYSFFKAVMQGSQQVPSNASTGKGIIIVKFNNQTKLLELVGDYQGLTTTITASHIHGPAAAGSNASVLITLSNSGGTSGTLSGNATLTPVQEGYLFAGTLYVNVHNSTYPGGEIRGQLSQATQGETQYFFGMLSGTQQVPQAAGEATGSVTVILDKTTREVFVTGSYQNLAAAATAGHIHRGEAGTNGPVVVPLSVTNATSGTINGSGVVSQAFADSMIRGFSYVNIHNSTYPGGEIRTQLGDQVLPLKLVYFNGFKDRNSVVLLWETTNEINVAQYEVEQQNTSTGQWTTKTAVRANGLGTVSKYRLNDVPSALNSDYAVYRLKMIDKDGSFSYSNTVRVNYVRQHAELTLLANPVSNGTLRYMITGFNADKKADVSVIDMNGRLLMRTSGSSLSANQLNVSRLSSGTYRLVVRIDGEVMGQTFIR